MYVIGIVQVMVMCKKIHLFMCMCVMCMLLAVKLIH